MSFGQQDLIITGVFDGPLSGGTPKLIEIYVLNDIADLSTYGFGSANNGGGTDGQEIAFAGSATAGDFIYVASEGSGGSANPGSVMTYFGITPDYIDSGAVGINGDDAIELFNNGIVIDTFGDIDCDPNSSGTTCPEWEYLDGWAYRSDGTGPEGQTFTLANWSFSGANAVDGCTDNATCGSMFPIGTYTRSGSNCGVTLGAASVTCNANTLGDNNDSVTINIPYTGSDAGITNVTTTTSGTVTGDPATVADGTITITGLSEGDAWDITLIGGDCDGRTTSGTVGAAECDPTPNTCFDLSSGPNSLELVSIVSNSSGTGGAWQNNTGTYTVNAYCGGGCAEPVDSWLVFGPLDMTSVTDLELLFDAAEQFGTTDLVINYTSSYSGCPSGTTWTTAQTLTDAGSYSIPLGAATGTDVYIGIAYTDDGADGYSNWTLTNVSLGAFGNCPTLGAVVPSDCAMCDVTLGTESYTCNSNTDGNDNDSVTVEIPYTGSDAGITDVTTTTSGTVTGDPSTVADGSITITGLSEGDAWDITLVGGDCDGTTLSGTIPASNCNPSYLVINEILADPDGSTGDANGDGVVDTSDDEFVELYNTGVDPIDLSGYTIEDGATNPLRHTFAMGTMLPAGEFIVVFGAGTPTGFGMILTATASSGGLGLNNGGDTVTVRDNNGVIVAQVVDYTDASSNQSIGRDPDFTGPFTQHTNIGTANVAFSPGLENDDPTLSVTQFEAGTFSVYPNPTNTGFVNIRSNNNEAISVSVFDILGKEVVNQTVSNNRLNVSTLNAGIYIMKISQNETSITKKLVIK